MVYRKSALLALVSCAVACSCSSPAFTNQSGGHLTQTDKAAIEWFDTLGFPDLSNCELSDPSPLADFNDLRTLSLYNNPIHDLSALTNAKLEELFLGETQVTDVTPLVRLTNLQWLFLNDTPVTDVSPLAELTSLRGLDLTGTRVSEADVRKMQQELPNCCIIGPGPARLGDSN